MCFNAYTLTLAWWEVRLSQEEKPEKSEHVAVWYFGITEAPGGQWLTALQWSITASLMEGVSHILVVWLSWRQCGQSWSQQKICSLDISSLDYCSFSCLFMIINSVSATFVCVFVCGEMCVCVCEQYIQYTLTTLRLLLHKIPDNCKLIKVRQYLKRIKSDQFEPIF